MMPLQRCMDSYPHQSTQMPFTHYYQPGFEAVAPHMKTDPTSHNVGYESWPCGGNFIYPIPWNSCYNHNSFPAYYGFRPPYPHIPPSPPVHCCGGHPGYQQAYPAYYLPPPHYTMNLPRFEYDKNLPRNDHCCGCPNHNHDQKEDRGVKIEEQELDSESKGSGSVLPREMENCPYPVVWIPPEYVYNKDGSEPVEPKAAEPDEVVCRAKPPEIMKSNAQEPTVWGGWSPFDTSNLGSLMQGGHGKTTKNQQKENRSQLRFPIIWMPYHDKQEDAGNKDKGMDLKPKTAKEPPYAIKFIPVSPPQSDDIRNASIEKNSGSHWSSPIMEEKIADQKDIPIKQVESQKEEDSSADTQSRGRSVNTMKKVSGGSSRRQSSSPPKTSPKLPPVCLRVDPLPKKKNGNGSPRSPSPPGPKGHSDATPTDTLRANMSENRDQDSRSQKNVINSGKEVNPKEKVIEVEERKNGEDKDGESRSQVPVNYVTNSTDGVSGKRTARKDGKDGEACHTREDKGARSEGVTTPEEPEEAMKVYDTAKLVGDESKVQKKILTDEEAATYIQSAYRGYEVRKWEPLKKLKQIAEVRLQMVDVQNHIRNLESSSGIQRNDKQIEVIGETIMRLLLKLDTIQGLHSTVRDIRKSLAKELVTLQEKLDSLMIKSSEEAINEATTSEHMQQHPSETHDGSCMQVVTEEAAEPGEGSSHKLKEQRESGLLDMTGTLPSSQREENLRSPSANEENEKSEVENSKISAASGTTPKELNDVGEGNAEYSEQEQSTELPSVCVQTIKSGKTMQASSDDGSSHGISVEEMEELPNGASDEKFTLLETEKDEQGRLENNEAQESGVEANMFGNVSLSANVGDLMAAKVEPEVDHLEKLSVGGLEECRAVPELEERERVEVEGERKCDRTLNVTPPDDETQIASQFERQPLGVPQEEQIIAEFPGWIKAGHQEDEELSKDTAHEIVGEQPSESSVVSESAEPQPTVSLVETQGHGEVHGDVSEGLNDVEHTCTPVLTGVGDNTEAELSNCKIEEDKDSEEGYDEQPAAVREEKKEAEGAGEKERQDDVELEQHNGSETVKDSPLHVEMDEVEGESQPMSATAREASTDEQNVGTESDRRLVEENEKLRTMMERLIDAGKEQLTTISALNARVKDLEKKLARQKKLKTGHSGRATSRSSCVKPSNKPLKEGPVGVAL